MLGRFLAHLLLCLVLCGCATPSQLNTPANGQPTVNLTIDQQTVSFDFMQDGQKISFVGNAGQWKVMLKPKPFTLEAHGNENPVSLLALKDATLFRSLREISAPVVVFTGTSDGYDQNNLLLTDTPLEVYEGTSAFFTDIWAESPARALELSAYLEGQTSAVPMILLSRRTYWAGEQNFVNAIMVETIGNEPMQSGESLLLVVFIEKELGSITPQEPVTFQQIKWLEFSIDFE